MITEAYIPLITALVNATKAAMLKWKPYASNKNQVSANPTPDQMILLDRYFGTGVDGVQRPCVNLSIFNVPDGKFIDELVISRISDNAGLFDELDSLYNAAQSQVDRSHSDKIAPVLTHITQSLQQLNANP